MIFAPCAADVVVAFPFACSAKVLSRSCGKCGRCCPQGRLYRKFHAAMTVSVCPLRRHDGRCVGMYTPLCQRSVSVCPKALSRQKRRFAALFRDVRQIELESVYVTDFCIRSAKFVTFFCFVSAVFGAVFCVYAVFALCAVVNKAVRRLCLRRSFVGSRRFLKVRCRHRPIFASSV